MKKYLILSTLVFMVACGTTKFITPSQADVERGKDNYPGLTLTQLTEGQRIYMASCNKCHGYKKPSSRTASEWQRIIPEMTAKANRKSGNNTIDATKEANLLRYVTVMCTAPKK